MKLEASLPLVLLAGGLALLHTGRRTDSGSVGTRSLPDTLQFIAARLLLLNLMALCLLPLGEVVHPQEELIWLFQGVTALLLTATVPLKAWLGVSPPSITLSLPGLQLPAGLRRGVTVSGYAMLPLLLIGMYALYLETPFLVFNMTALWAVVLTLLTLRVPDRALRELNSVIPVLTGFSLLLALGLSTDVGEINFYISSLFEEKLTFLFTALIMLLLGFFTGIGPSSLPFLPLVFGTLIARRKSRAEIALSVAGFALAFIATHSLAGALASAGAVVLSDIFRVGVFNLILALVLMLLALHLLNLFPLHLDISRLNPFRNPGMNSFFLGIAYTFSVCPSCASLFLGAVILSASAENLYLSVLYMSIYAVGRAVPVFLSGLLVGSISGLLKHNHTYVNKLAGLVFLFLSLYFFKNFLEVLI